VEGADQPGELCDSEWGRFFLIVSLTLRPIELAFLDYVDGRISTEMWQGQENTIKYWIHSPGFQRWLQDYGETLDPKFIEHIEKVVQDVRANGHA